MKATRNEDGTYDLTGMTAKEAISLYQIIYDWYDDVISSGDELDESEAEVFDKALDLRDLWDYHEGAFT